MLPGHAVTITPAQAVTCVMVDWITNICDTVTNDEDSDSFWNIGNLMN
jgi:hypothetical protein